MNDVVTGARITRLPTDSGKPLARIIGGIIALAGPSLAVG